MRFNIIPTLKKTPCRVETRTRNRQTTPIYKEVIVKNGTCPKCGSKSIYCGDKIPLKSGPFGSNSIPVSIISMAALDNYVCVDCGLVESYVADDYMLKKISQKWKSLNGTADQKD